MSVEKRKRERKGKKEREKEREKARRKRKGGRGRKIDSFVLYRRSDGRSSLGRELKSFTQLGLFGRIFIRLPCFNPTHCPNFGTDFDADFVLISRLIWDGPMAGLVVRFGAIMAYFETVLVAGLVACV